MRMGFILRLLILLIVCFAGMHLGRGLWQPIYVNLVGGKTTDEVLHKIEEPGLSRLGLTRDDVENMDHLTLIGIKDERLLELWVHSAEGQLLLKTYPFTAFSGALGPKLEEGDGQIPEGMYRIEYLNPNSSYHLSMKLNYPNAFDRAKGDLDGRDHLGFDIFIHGSNVTIGCIPIGDQAIEEVFYLVSKVGVEHVDVILAPFDMRKGERMLEVDEISWEAELYRAIDKVLQAF